MTRSRRRTAVLAHYAAVAALAVLAVGDAIPFRVFAMLFAVPAVALFGVERLTLGGLTMRAIAALDEREHLLVAEAHRLAHRLALGLAVLLALAALLFGAGASSSVAVAPFAIAALALIAVSTSLPAGIVLWTAPTPLESEVPGPDGARP